MKAVTVTMYMRLEIAAVSRSFQALSTWGTKLAVDRMPAIVARIVGSQELIETLPSLSHANGRTQGEFPRTGATARTAQPLDRDRPLPSSPLSSAQASGVQGRRLVFVVTEDWFFASHFLPMARAARELGLDVAG